MATRTPQRYTFIGDTSDFFTKGKVYERVLTEDLQTDVLVDDKGRFVEVDEPSLSMHFEKYQAEPTPEEDKEEEPVRIDGGGLRYNEGKLRYDLVHPVGHEGMVKVLTAGAKKYKARNWERGMSWTSVIASAKRHIAAFEAGEDYDAETGLLHIDHAACGMHFLSSYYKIYPQGDDRRETTISQVRVGLDIDEVLCDWLGDWTEHRGLESPTSWYFDRGLKEEFDRLRSEDKLDEFYLSLRPLIKGEELPFEPHCYITSRPVDTKITEQWLQKHGFPARPVFTAGLGKSKVEIAKEQGIDIFVDDGYHNFMELNRAGITCYLYDAPHNRRYDVGHKRIKSLKELL
jgi:hypothetical protein